MTLATLDMNPTADAVASVIVLHGLGADGTDFIPLCDELDLAAIGPVRFVMPRAPIRPVTVNGGYEMRAWYDILGTDLARREDEAGLRESARQVGELIAREVARGVPSQRIVLAGFSQGCAIALLAGLRQPAPLAGLVGLSGYLPLADSTAAERHPANQTTPIFLAHGRQDGVVPLARGAASRDALLALGYRVDWQDYAMAHAVCAEEITALNRWLLRVLG